MKTVGQFLILFFFLFFISTTINAQNCRTPMVDQLFQPKYNQVKAQLDDELRFDIATLHLQNNCFTSLQIKYFARLFIEDNVRFDYAKQAYQHCTDTENYYEVLDAFKKLPFAFHLYDFIKAQQAPQVIQTNNTPPPLPPCQVSVSDFEQINKTINNESVGSTQLTLAKQIVSAKKCFTAVQIKELVKIFSVESYRLEFAKYSYDFCIDKENYFLIADAFSTSSSKNQLMEFIGSKK